MSLPDIPLDALCRTCTTKSRDLQNLFQIVEHGETLADKIFTCTRLLIQEQIDRPSNICNKCFSLLKSAFEFHNLVKNCESTFQKLINPVENVDVNETKTHILDILEFKTEKDQERAFMDQTISESNPYEYRDYKQEIFDEHQIEQKTFLNLKKTERLRKKDITIKKRNSEKNFKCFECYKCKKPLTSLWKTSVHLKQHDAEEKFKCNVCGVRFILWEDFSRHLCQGTNINCAYCDKTFVATIALLNHLDISHNEKTLFKCEKCAQFFSMALLKQYHMSQHLIERTEESKPFVCKICNKGFGTKISLRNHEEIHSDEKRKLNQQS